MHDYGALGSAQYAPAQHRYYGQTEDMAMLGAVLLARLIRNHPFHNANKRTAYAAVTIFLDINGYVLDAPQDEVLEVCVGLADTDDRYTEEEVAQWLASHCMPGAI